MATPNKLTDPHKVASALKAHHTKRAAAKALGVSRQALYGYIAKNIQEICEYIVIEPTHDIRATRSDEKE